MFSFLSSKDLKLLIVPASKMYKSSRAAGLCKTVSTGTMPGPSIQMTSLFSDEPEGRGMWLSRNHVLSLSWPRQACNRVVFENRRKVEF